MGTKKEGKSCFIITPIGSPKSEIFRKANGVIASVIRPVLEEKGFVEIKAAHEISEVGSINTQIINRIIDCDLVIANLTTNNPNVMYELCLRHVVAKPIIHICETGTNLPFDIKDNRTIFYDDDMLGASELRKELEKFVDEIDYEKEYKDNPIYNAKQIGNLLKDVPAQEGKQLEVKLLQTILNKLDYFERKPIREKLSGYEGEVRFVDGMELLIRNCSNEDEWPIIHKEIREILESIGVHFMWSDSPEHLYFENESNAPIGVAMRRVDGIEKKYNIDILIKRSPIKRIV